MDAKTARRNFYKNKVYLSEKYDEEYTAQKFQDDLTYMLNEFIPKANLKQLTKFMEKKYDRIIKTFPEVEKALKKVIKDKLNGLPAELRQAQIQKLLNHIKEQCPNLEMKVNAQEGYIFVAKDKCEQTNLIKKILIENKLVTIPRQTGFVLDTTQRENPLSGKYTLSYFSNGKQQIKVFASTFAIENQRLDVKRGNIEREINSFLQKMNKFMHQVDVLEALEL